MSDSSAPDPGPPDSGDDVPVNLGQIADDFDRIEAALGNLDASSTESAEVAGSD